MTAHTRPRWITFDRSTVPAHLRLLDLGCACEAATVSTHMQTGSIACEVEYECARGHRFRVVPDGNAGLRVEPVPPILTAPTGEERDA